VSTARPHPLDLSGKLVLVTGASSGIGRATAILLGQLGARVILSGRREDALRETRSQLPEPEKHPVEVRDLADIDAIPPWLKEVVARAGAPLDGLVHSAGVGGLAPLRTLSKKTIDSVMTPNLFAALALMRGASAKGASKDGASLVMISSVAGLVSSPGLVAYSASKGALHAAVRSAAQELKERKIRVNCVAPGYVETPMMEQSRAENPAGFEAIAQRQFLGFAKPEEVATAVAYLLSDAARVITGTTLVLDGGFSS
jgi:NAD(P)-dependent dehydrogenase (short-subunit alcohol dehydrogenase family)